MQTAHEARREFGLLEYVDHCMDMELTHFLAQQHQKSRKCQSVLRVIYTVLIESPESAIARTGTIPKTLKSIVSKTTNTMVYYYREHFGPFDPCRLIKFKMSKRMKPIVGHDVVIVYRTLDVSSPGFRFHNQKSCRNVR